jgi:hypothetical protein
MVDEVYILALGTQLCKPEQVISFLLLFAYLENKVCLTYGFLYRHNAFGLVLGTQHCKILPIVIVLIHSLWSSFHIVILGIDSDLHTVSI